MFEKHTQHHILIQFFQTAHLGNGMIFSLHFINGNGTAWYSGKSISTSFTNDNLSILQVTRVISYVYVWIWSHRTITCDLLLNSVFVEPNPCHLTSVSTLHRPLIQWFVLVVQVKMATSETSSYFLCSICTSIKILIHCNILSKTPKMQLIFNVHINTFRVLQYRMKIEMNE